MKPFLYLCAFTPALLLGGVAPYLALVPAVLGGLLMLLEHMHRQASSRSAVANEAPVGQDEGVGSTAGDAGSLREKLIASGMLKPVDTEILDAAQASSTSVPTVLLASAPTLAMLSQSLTPVAEAAVAPVALLTPEEAQTPRMQEVVLASQEHGETAQQQPSAGNGSPTSANDDFRFAGYEASDDWASQAV